MELCDPPDIISDLPINIIEHILMRLPISNAVGTSILSTKWRYKWMALPHLVIDSSLGEKLLAREHTGKYELVKVVYQLLLLHKGPILKFAFEATCMETCLDFDRWIHFLSNHDIQEFTFSRPKDDLYKLPSYFFNFQHLRHLKLRFCAIKPPPGFKGFDELITLELDEAIVDDETFGYLVSSCPLLERLYVRFGLDIQYYAIEISAPNLKSLSLTAVFGSISFKKTPLLKEVYICLIQMHPNAKNQSSNLVELATSLPAVEKLHLGGTFLGYLSSCEALVAATHFEHLRALHIAGMWFGRLEAVLCALLLITNSPNLEYLKIVAFVINRSKDEVVEYFKKQNLPCCSMKRLRRVRMEWISNFEPQLLFIKFILENSPMLEEMEIIQMKNLRAKDERNLWKEVMRFRRASPKAQVIM